MAMIAGLDRNALANLSSDLRKNFFRLGLILWIQNCGEVQPDGFFPAGESVHPQPCRVHVFPAAIQSHSEIPGVGVLD